MTAIITIANQKARRKDDDGNHLAAALARPPESALC